MNLEGPLYRGGDPSLLLLTGQESLGCGEVDSSYSCARAIGWDSDKSFKGFLEGQEVISLIHPSLLKRLSS